MRGPALLVSAWYGCLLAAQAQNFSYYFTTIAGQAGVSGSADGTNHAALFYQPSDLALDAAGALYVSDTFNNTIRKLTPAGGDWVVSTVAGLPGVVGAQDGANSDARFYRPNGLAFGPTGDLFVADHNNHMIRKIAWAGTNAVVSTIAGLAGVFGTTDGTNSGARFRIPMGIAVDGAGRVFVVDTANFTIRMVTPVGTDWVTTTIAGTPYVYGFQDGLNQAATFNYPYGMALGPDGALYVNDAGNNAIRQITAVAKGWSTAKVANRAGTMGSQDGPALQAAFDTPNGIVLDGAQNIYVADQWNHTIRKLTYSGRGWDVTTIGGVPGVYGTADGLGTNALFRMPWGVAVDGGGAIYVADAYNHTIRRGVPAIVLQLAAYGNQVVLSWPTVPDGFRLEKTAQLGSGAVWETVANGVVLAGDHYVMTNQLSGPAAFYRLGR